MSEPTRRYHVPSALRRSALRLEPDEARELVDRGALLIDVRRRENDVPPPEGALQIPPDEIPGRLGEFPRDTPIVLACT
jgi:rhodanese-related sulfurtransferase